MSSEEMVSMFRQQLANLLVYKKADVVDSLNQSGFPSGMNISENELISLTLKGLSTNESFKDKLINLMEGKQSVQGFKNFAPQPVKGGGVFVIGADDLKNGVQPGCQDFIDFPVFQDKCNGLT